jgi:hypothetical protein
MFAALAQMHGFSSGSVRGGNNSWWISHPVTGRRWNVRWRRGPWRLEVGARKVVITSEQQAIKWFEKNA